MQYPAFDPGSPDTPLTPAELDELDALLRTLPAEAAMNVEAMDGYVTALLLAPTPLPTVPTAHWLPPVWGGDGAGDSGNAPFTSGRQRKKAIVMVLRHVQSIACRLLRADAPEDAWEPVFSVAEVDGLELADAEDWCIGFLQGVALDPEGWSPVFDDPELGPLLTPIALLGGDDSALGEDDRARLADPEHRDALSRAAADAVAALAAHRMASRAAAKA
jgi:uncharacterized protein